MKRFFKILFQDFFTLHAVYVQISQTQYSIRVKIGFFWILATMFSIIGKVILLWF